MLKQNKNFIVSAGNKNATGIELRIRVQAVNAQKALKKVKKDLPIYLNNNMLERLGNSGTDIDYIRAYINPDLLTIDNVTEEL